MKINEKICDYLTFPTTFEGYKWYKPILVFIIGFIITLILSGIVVFVFLKISGIESLHSVLSGGYEALDSQMGLLFSDLLIIIIIPSLYIATKIVKDRPFSSYSSSRGGWNFKLYLKALVIPLTLFIIYEIIDTAIKGPKGTYHFSVLFFIMTLITVPLQCIAEEYVYRGLIMQTFGSWFKIPVLAIFIQSVIFSLSHSYNGLGLIEILITGFALGFFTWKTNGIEVSSAIHTANNFSISLFVMLGLQYSTSNPSLSDTAATIVFEIILFIIMYYVGKKTDWFGEIPENSQNTGLFKRK